MTGIDSCGGGEVQYNHYESKERAMKEKDSPAWNIFSMWSDMMLELMKGQVAFVSAYMNMGKSRGMDSMLTPHLENLIEKTFIQKSKELVGSPTFLSQVSGEIQTSLKEKKDIDTAIKEYLETRHMPTKSDIAAILQFLHQLESKMLDIEEKIENMEEPKEEKKDTSGVKKSTGAKKKK